MSLSVQVDPGLRVPSQGEDAFRGQITRDRVLEDSLRLLLPPPAHLQTNLSLATLRQQVSLCCRNNGKQEGVQSEARGPFAVPDNNPGIK